MSSMRGTEATAGPVLGDVAPQDTPATGQAGSNPVSMAAVTEHLAHRGLPVQDLLTR